MERMHFSKRVHYLILLFIILLNAILRYPITPHELGIDSFYIHQLGESISRNGYASWAFHPLSYFGMLPYSYPIAVPYLISGFHQISEIPMEITVYLFSLFIGILGIFTAYVAAGEIINDDRFRFLVALSFSTAPVIIKFTSWTVSTRGLLLVMTPIFLYLLYRTETSIQSQRLFFFLLTLLLVIILGTVHKMFWIMFILWILFYIVNIFHNIGHNRSVIQFSLYKKHIWWIPFASFMIIFYVTILLLFMIKDINISISRLVPNLTIWSWFISAKELLFFILLVLVFISFLMWIMGSHFARMRALASFSISLIAMALFLIQFTNLAPWQTYWWLSIIVPPQFWGPETTDVMLSLFVVIGARIGVFLIISIFGFIIVIWQSKPDKKRMFTLVSIMALLPFFHIAMYIYQMLSVYFYLLGALFLLRLYSWLSNRKKHPLISKAVGVIVVLVILSSSFLFTVFTVAYRIDVVDIGEGGGYGGSNILSEEEYNIGIFMRYYCTDKQSREISTRIGAIAGREIEINMSRIELSRRKAPEFTDFYGWYGYFQSPLIAEVGIDKPDNYYTMGRSALTTSSDPDYSQYNLYSNGRLDVFYVT